MARVVGGCRRNRMANRTAAPTPTWPRAATHPVTGGSAPGTAPITMARGVTSLSGVEAERDRTTVDPGTLPGGRATARARETRPVGGVGAPKAGAPPRPRAGRRAAAARGPAASGRPPRAPGTG